MFSLQFQRLRVLVKLLNFNVYYCEPYTSYQRESNENANGLVRWWYKKGTNFNEVSDQEIYELQEGINNMPRKILEWKSSSQTFNELAN